MLTQKHIGALTALITKYAEVKGLVPPGQQLHVSFDLKPLPDVPLVVVSGTLSAVTPDVSISSIGLKTRTFTALNYAGVKTAFDVINAVRESGSVN